MRVVVEEEMFYVTTKYPFPKGGSTDDVEKKSDCSLTSLSVLWPVLKAVAHVLFALGYAFCAGCFSLLWVKKEQEEEEVDYLHQETATNSLIRSAVSEVSYSPTPYFVTGDVQTLAPFVLFKNFPKLRYVRKWLRVAAAPAPDGPRGFERRPLNNGEDESCALDCCEPVVRRSEVVYLVLHGLNGGSHEPYVQDFVERATEEKGATVVVMVARGLMQTPVRGSEIFHGARTSDVGETVRWMRSRGGYHGRPIVLVGFSMGAIVASNYIAKSGSESGVVGCVAVSGILCTDVTLTKHGDHSRRLWQPFLAYSLKETFLTASGVARLLRRQVDLKAILEAPYVDSFEKTCVCSYHRYPNLADYYEDMSAAGAGDSVGFQKLAQARVPLVLLNARNDPITTFEACVAAKAAHASPNVFCIATKSGGHVGWPQKMQPTDRKWAFAAEITFAVTDALLSSRAAAPSSKPF